MGIITEYEEQVRDNRTQPKISVIVPFYNTEAEFSRCLDALVGQTYTDIEILLIDDASVDGSLKIAEEFARRDERIRILNNEVNPPLTDKLGVARARNLGLSAARGKYIMFCDSDDYYEPNMVELMVRAMEENPEADLASCSTEVHQIGWQEAGLDAYLAKHKEGMSDFLGKAKAWESGNLWNKIFKRSLFDSYNIRCRKFVGQGTDQNLSGKYFCVSRKIYHIKTKLYHYVLRADSIMGETHKNEAAKLLCVAENFEDVADFCDEYGLWAENADYLGERLRDMTRALPDNASNMRPFLPACRILIALAKRIKIENITDAKLQQDISNYRKSDLRENLWDEKLKYTPKVSIIVPFYNTEAELPRCLESLVGQTYGNIEILLINDVSTDNSLNIAEQFACKDKRIRILNNEHYPPLAIKLKEAGARNLGFERALGVYIMACDSDDYYQPNMVERMVRAMEENPEADLASCSVRVHHVGWQDTGMDKYLTNKEEGLLKFTQSLKAKESVILPNKIFKRAIIEKYNIRAYIYPSQSPDENFSSKYFAVSREIYHIKEALYNYALRENSIMGQSRKNYAERLMLLLEHFEDAVDFSKKNGVWEENTEYFSLKLKQIVWFFSEYVKVADPLIPTALLMSLAERINTDLISDESLRWQILDYRTGILKEISLPLAYKRRVKDYRLFKLSIFKLKYRKNIWKYYLFGLRLLKVKLALESKRYYIAGINLFTIKRKNAL